MNASERRSHQDESATADANASSELQRDGDIAELRPEEERVPNPTYIPAAMAMGIMMLLWGILTNWLMSLAGALLMIWALQAWVRELHET